jgi:hypothetical protein
LHPGSLRVWLRRVENGKSSLDKLNATFFPFFAVNLQKKTAKNQTSAYCKWWQNYLSDCHN